MFAFPKGLRTVAYEYMNMLAKKSGVFDCLARDHRKEDNDYALNSVQRTQYVFYVLMGEALVRLYKVVKEMPSMKEAEKEVLELSNTAADCGDCDILCQ